MSDNRHRDCLVTRPAKESRYAFLLMSFAINDVEPTLPPWSGPVKITQDMEPVVKAYHERWNPILAVFEDGFRKQAIEGLRRAGVPETNLVAPLNSEAEAVIRDLTNGYRLELRYLSEKNASDVLQRNAPFDGERYARELCARVITATGYALGSPGHEMTAKYLNAGLPSGERGLTRHHVRRAGESCRKMWERLIRAIAGSSLGLPVSAIVELMDADRVTVGALDLVYRQARTRSEFRMRRGEDLAWAIHNQFDLNERIHRAACWVRAKRTAVA